MQEARREGQRSETAASVGATNTSRARPVQRLVVGEKSLPDLRYRGGERVAISCRRS